MRPTTPIIQTLALALVLAGCSGQKPVAKDDNVSDRLTALEREVERLSGEIEQLRMRRAAPQFGGANSDAVFASEGAPLGQRQMQRQRPTPAKDDPADAQDLAGQRPQRDPACAAECKVVRQQCARQVQSLAPAERRPAAEKCREQAQACRQACQK